MQDGGQLLAQVVASRRTKGSGQVRASHGSSSFPSCKLVPVAVIQPQMVDPSSEQAAPANVPPSEAKALIEGEYTLLDVRRVSPGAAQCAS